MISKFSSTDRFLYTRYIVLSYLFSISQQHLRKDHKTPQAIANVVELGQLVQGHHLQQQQQPNLKLEEQWPRGAGDVHHDQPPPDEVIASAGLQDQPPPPPGPPNIAYRIDGEVLQLTRVPQDEAMRLVNSGATVIHVASEADDNDPLAIQAAAGSSGSGRMTTSHLQPAQPQPTFHQQPSRSSSSNVNRGHHGGLNGYDLPAELVQVLVAPEETATAAASAAAVVTAAAATTAAGAPAVSAVTGRPRNSGSGGAGGSTSAQQQQPQIEATPPTATSQHQDWINAYRR